VKGQKPGPQQSGETPVRGEIGGMIGFEKKNRECGTIGKGLLSKKTAFKAKMGKTPGPQLKGRQEEGQLKRSRSVVEKRRREKRETDVFKGWVGIS